MALAVPMQQDYFRSIFVFIGRRTAICWTKLKLAQGPHEEVKLWTVFWLSEICLVIFIGTFTNIRILLNICILHYCYFILVRIYKFIIGCICSIYFFQSNIFLHFYAELGKQCRKQTLRSKIIELLIYSDVNKYSYTINFLINIKFFN